MYLKLHGSLNWVVCKNRKCIEYNKNIFVQSPKSDISSIQLADYKVCKHCGKMLDTNIIPPCSEKIDIHKNSLFSKQWRIVRKKFRSSHRIVFIGYSFPTTDFYSEWLFRQINYLVNDKTEFIGYEIEVINPEANKKDPQLKQRYDTIFKGHTIKYYGTLKEYADLVS
jgi:hypothetical protein